MLTLPCGCQQACALSHTLPPYATCSHIHSHTLSRWRALSLSLSVTPRAVHILNFYFWQPFFFLFSSRAQLKTTNDSQPNPKLSFGQPTLASCAASAIQFVVVSNWFYAGRQQLTALGIFHCVSKFKLIFLIARRSHTLSLLLPALSLLSLSHSLSEIAAGTHCAGILFICVILIYSTYYSFCYYVNATAALTFAFAWVSVCVCVCLRLYRLPLAVCVRVCVLRQAAFAVHFNVFRFFSDLSAIRAVFFFAYTFLFLLLFLIFVFVWLLLLLSAAEALASL